MGDLSVPNDQPPSTMPIQRRRATRPAKGDRSKAERVHTPPLAVELPDVQPEPGAQLMSPQSLCAGSLPSVSVVQVALVPNTSPLSAYKGLAAHIVSSPPMI